MNRSRTFVLLTGTLCLSAASLVPLTARQAPTPAPAPAEPAQGRGGAQAPQVVSPEVGSDRRITFRLHMPQAQAVRFNAGDIPGLGQTAVPP